MKLSDLKKPFPSNRISWRIGQAGKNGDRIWVKALAYFDARDGMDRLDEVLGAENWRDSYRYTGKENASVVCRIEIKIGDEWVGKEDGSEETDIEAVKGGMSGAFKRACVKWGIGRYLYDLPQTFANTCDKDAEGAIYARTQELGTFYWQAPQLPNWAKPDSELSAVPLPRVERQGSAAPSDMPSFPAPKLVAPKPAGAVGICPECSGKMMVSKYPNKVTGEIDFYCSKCKKSHPRTA